MPVSWVHYTTQPRVIADSFGGWLLLLQSEMHVHGVCERFGLLLETYVRHCGPHRHQLWRQQVALSVLEKVTLKSPLAAEELTADTTTGGCVTTGGLGDISAEGQEGANRLCPS